MKPAGIACFLLFLAAIAIGLVQLWLHIWSDDIFLKLIVTDIAFLAVCCVWAFMVKESKDSRKLNGGNSLD